MTARSQSGESRATERRSASRSRTSTPKLVANSSTWRPSISCWPWTYGHLNGDYLTQFTAGDTGQAWHYDYDTSHRLSTITTPDAKVTKITYSGTSSKVASIINTTNSAHTTGPTTTYTYSSPTSPCQSTNFDYAKIVVSRPDGGSTTYCANNYAQVTYDTDNPTSAVPSGDWYDLHDAYTNGGSHSIAFSGADAGAGVKSMALEEVGGAQLAASTQPCDPRNAVSPTACPHTASGTAAFNASSLAEGKHVFHQVTRDYAGNALSGVAWNVFVDKTPPLAAAGFDATYDPDSMQTVVSWDEAGDPALADGSPGSGAATYVYQVQRGTGAYSGWSPIADPWIVLDTSHDGESISVKVQAVDGAGNVGPASMVSLTAGQSSLTDIDIGSVDGGSDQTPLDSEPDSTDPDDGTVGPDNAFAARDAYSEILCADSSPCGTYKPFDAASYARKWDLHREYEDDAAARRDHNNNYGYFGGQGGDCQNFVSQSLKAGGLRFMRAEGENSPDGTATGQSSKYHHGEGSWWSMYQETPAGAGSNLPLRSYDVTESFIRSKQLYHHLLDYDLATTEPPGTRVHTGDLLFYNLHGMSIDGTGDIGRDGEPDKGLDHTQIITRVTQNRVYVSQHSPGYTRSLRDVIDNNDDSDSTEPKHVWNTDWRFIIVRPHHTAANIGS